MTVLHNRQSRKLLSTLSSNNYTTVSDTTFKEIADLIFEKQDELSTLLANEEIDFHIRHRETGNTLIHEFIKFHDCTNIVEFLVNEAGIDVDGKNFSNLAPIHVAATENSLEVCKVLQNLRADMESRGGPLENPLHPVSFAVHEKREAIAIWMLQNHYKEKEFDRDLFEMIINNTPKAAMAYLDHFSQDVGGGFYYYSKGAELYGETKQKGALNMVMSRDDENTGLILSHRSLQRILNVKWEAFAKEKYNWEVFVYGIFVFSFTVPNILWVDQDNFVDIERQDMQARHVAALTFKIVSWVLASYHLLFIERKELSSQGYKEYFSSFWNWINIVTYFLMLATIPFEFISDVEKYRDFMLAMVSVLLWSNILQFAEVYKGLGPMVSLMGRMIHDIVKLGFLFLVIQIGFAGGFFYIFHGKEGYMSFFDSWMTVFLFMYGQIQYTEQFYKLEERYAYYCGTFLLISYMVIVTTILYNMLIALMASTYTSVQEASDKLAIKTKAETILRLEKKLDDKRWKDIYKRVTLDESHLDSNPLNGPPTTKFINLDATQRKSGKNTLPTVVDGIDCGTQDESKTDMDKEIPKMAFEISQMRESIDEILGILSQLTESQK